MKVLVGGIYHESHSFSNVPTDLEAFRKVLLLEGQEVLDKLAGTTSEMAGFIKGANRFGFEPVPTVWAWGTSTGPVQAETLDYLLEGVRRRCRAAGPIDGVLFALHGALIAEQALDGDGYILTQLRSLVTEDVPIAVTVDFHANISPLMVEVADVIVGYDTYPHIDQVERGLEAAELLVATVRGEIKPTMALEKPPLITVPNKQRTDESPMKDVLTLARAAEHDVLSVTVSGGFAYSDVPEIGTSVLVVTNNDPELARSVAKKIAGQMWELRDRFSPNLPSVSESVRAAISSETWPVILADIGDNIGAGTPGDSTFLLRELLDQNAQGAVVIIADPQAVAVAIEAGLGSNVNLAAGGKCDSHHGDPVQINGTVELITDGSFRNRGHMRDGIVENMGRTVVISTAGITLVLTEVKMPPWNLEQLRSVGIAPEKAKIIALKSAVAFRAAYEPIAGKIIEVNTPGLSSLDLSRFDYKHVRRPIYPIDQIERC
jgi:microcystin degradation protein MlrC